MSTFITNKGDRAALTGRLESLISISRELKFLVGFFYFSGWREIYKSIKDNEEVKLRILVGLQVDKYLSELVEVEKKDDSTSIEEQFSLFMKSLGFAINNSQMDNEEFYNQVNLFIELLENNRLEIRKTLNPNHAKLYLFNVKENQFNIQGQFITGSSNLTKAGLKGQEEFNVEIRDYGYKEANEYFDEIWRTGVPITEAENGKEIIKDFLKNKSQSSLITPYEAYVFILKTYLDLQESKRVNDYLDRILIENGFDKYSYQLDAVNQALNIINTYNGVIIADVVGLGKSVVASLIANQLGKRGLILSPPGLIGNKHENSGWWEYLNKFKLYNWDIESTGNIEAVSESLNKHDRGYEVIIIDEVHKFRNQDTSAYEALLDICRGRKVVLLTATPFNNSPADIFSLLKLFIVPGQSGITIESDLEGRFSAYNARFKSLSHILKYYKSKDDEKRESAEKSYTKMFGNKPPVNVHLVKDDVSKMANDIKSVISPVVIRRNRLDLKNDFEYKKEIKNISDVKDPEEIFFYLTETQSDFYNRIIEKYFCEAGEFTGAIYKPYEYENKPKKKKGEDDNRIILQQRNLYDFMRRLLVKRFESSFGAFDKSIDRFLKVHKIVKSFIETSGRYILDRKIIESIYDDDDKADDFKLEEIEKALKEFKEKSKIELTPKNSKIYTIKDFYFKEKFKEDIDKDIELFEKIKEEINQLDLVADDPKRVSVLDEVKGILKEKCTPKRKVIIFTEYTDTVDHLKEYFKPKLNGRVLVCAGGMSKKFEIELNSNFNAKYSKYADDYDLLITSDKLSEGFNLNRAGIIINYDIPWNPTRVIQRLGRINRIGTKVFDKLYIRNIFPTEIGASVVKSKEIASQKMFLIHNALGEDSKIFEKEEVPEASRLFKKINSNPEDEDDLSTITKVRNEFSKIKENHPEIFGKIKNLPHRTKSAKKYDSNNTVVLRKKGMSLFSLLDNMTGLKGGIKEQSFDELIKYVECDFDEKRIDLSKKFWQSYEAMKTYSPRHSSILSDLSLEAKAVTSLKSLLKKNREGLDQILVAFVGTIIKDLKTYKTLSTYTLRKLVLSENSQDGYAELITNLNVLRQKLGSDYLDIVINRSSKIEEDIIISVENRVE